MVKDPYDVMDLKALRCFWTMAKHASLTQAGICESTKWISVSLGRDDVRGDSPEGQTSDTTAQESVEAARV